jgi:hypothetical protein
MPVSPTRAAPAARPVDAGGEDLTRRAVTVAAGLIVACCFAFSFGNVWTLARNRGVPASIAWLVAPTVDLSVVALVVGVRYLSLRGVPGRQLRPARAMLLGVGVATWALNTAESLARRAWGTAAFDSLAPLLLLGWAEIGPWFLRQFHAVSVTEATPAPTADTVTAPAPVEFGPGALPPGGPVRQATGQRFDAPGTGLVPVANGTAPTANGTRGTPAGTTPAGTGKQPGRGGTDDAAVRAQARRIYDAQPGISGTSLARAIGRSDGYGRRLVRQFRAQPAQAPGPSRPGPGPGGADPLSAAPADTGTPLTTPGADGRPEPVPAPGPALVPAVVPAAPPPGREDGQHA